MQEFLVVIDEALNQERLDLYRDHARQHFASFDLNATCHTYRRDNLAILWFTQENASPQAIGDALNGNLLAYLGTWFFREQTNDKQENPKRLLKQLLADTDQTIATIEGAYNFILYDEEATTLKVITDRLSLRSLYTRRIGTAELLSSRCLLLASLAEFELDPIGLKEFLLANKNFGTKTLFKGIQKVNPSTILEYTGHDRKITSYWSVHFGQSKTDLSLNQKVEMFAAELTKAMKCIGELFNAPFADLTGGWDSRTSFVAMPKGLAHFATVTGGEPDSLDVIIAQELAQKMGVPHHVRQSFIASDLFAADTYAKYLKHSFFLTDGALGAPLYVSTLANQLRNLADGADISLNGSGGEHYRPIWWEPAYFYNSEFSRFKITLPGRTTYYNKRELVRRVVHQQSDLSVFTPDFDTNIEAHIINLFDTTNAPYMPISNVEQIANMYYFHRTENWVAAYSKATGRVIDCLSPLLLSKLLEIAVQLRYHEKAHGNFLRRVHALMAPEIGKVRMDYGYPSLPRALWDRDDVVFANQKKIKDISTKLAKKWGRKTAPPQNPIYQKNLLAIQRILNLNPDRLKLAAIFQKPNITAFLERSQDPNFPYIEFYHNIYTIETILNMLS